MYTAYPAGRAGSLGVRRARREKASALASSLC